MSFDAITGMWDRLVGAQPDPPALLVVLTCLAALVVVLTRLPWRIARNAITIAHEGGHGLAALLTGRRLTGIRLHSDTSGLTLSTGRARGPGMVVTAAAGYVSPSLVGLAGVALLALDRVTAMLWAAAVVLVAMLVMVRNWYGALSLTVTGAVVVVISLYASDDVQAAFAYAMTWFLLLGAVRPVVELRAQRRYQPGAPTDADILARLTRVPGSVWVVLFGVATLAALGFGGWLLLT